MTTIQFKDRKESIEFYERRYNYGYMGHWSSFEKERLLGLIRSLNLPETGSALDFGCGRGIFTAVIKEALPGWTVFGCDISKEAIESARKNSADISFFVLGEEKQYKGKFNFIHSHHVLEHSFDEKITSGEISSFAAEHCNMLHSLPCNHEGSLEYRLSHWTKNGFDASTGKFFFEDTAHLRRLNLQQAEALFSGYKFRVARACFANRYWGAIKWIAESNVGLVWTISPPFKAVSFFAFICLAFWRIMLVFSWFCFFAASVFKSSDRGKFYLLRKLLQACCFLLFFWLVIPTSMFISSKAKREWEEKKELPDGSDMFLFFER